MGDIKAIWFDLDDTLYDHTYSVCLGMAAVLARYPALSSHSSAEKRGACVGGYPRAANLGEELSTHPSAELRGARVGHPHNGRVGHPHGARVGYPHSDRVGHPHSDRVGHPQGHRSSAGLAAFYNQALNVVYTAYVRGEIDFREMRRRKLTLFYELAGIDEREAPGMDDFHRIYDEGYGQERRATPGCTEMLERLRDDGMSVGVLTNGRQAIQEDKLRVIGLEWLIPNLLTAERAKATKPDPRIYRWALAQAGQDAENVLMVGDSLENDVEAALRCGLSAVFFAPEASEASIMTAYGEAPVITEWSALPAVMGDHCALKATP